MSKENEYTEHSLRNQETTANAEIMKVGLGAKQMIENNTQFNQHVLEIDLSGLSDDKNKPHYALSKELKTGITSGKAPNNELLQRIVSHTYWLHTKPLPKLKGSYGQDLYGHIALSSSLKGSFIKDLLGVRIIFGKSKEEDNKDIIK